MSESIPTGYEQLINLGFSPEEIQTCNLVINKGGAGESSYGGHKAEFRCIYGTIKGQKVDLRMYKNNETGKLSPVGKIDDKPIDEKTADEMYKKYLPLAEFAAKH